MVPSSRRDWHLEGDAPCPPPDLALELGVTQKCIRDFLRKRYPRTASNKHERWYVDADQVAAVRARFGGGAVAPQPATTTPRTQESASQASRAVRDEDYVIDLCDEILGTAALRQHRFDWLRGDPGNDGRGVALPVDAYYPTRRLVVEYRERQHYEAIPHFDKPDVMTVSGVPRGQQRQLYDERREEEIPRNGLRLVVVRYDQLACRARRLARDTEHDHEVLRGLLA